MSSRRALLAAAGALMAFYCWRLTLGADWPVDWPAILPGVE